MTFCQVAASLADVLPVHTAPVGEVITRFVPPFATATNVFMP
jgi:hypothetical protein